MLAAWLDAVRWTVLAHARGYHVEEPVKTLAARLKVFAIKFARGSHSTKWITEGIAPSMASMSQWS